MAKPVFTMKMIGHREAVAKLRNLDKKLRRNITGKVMRAGAKVMVRALRQAAPSPGRTGTGAAKKSIGSKFKTYRGSLVAVAITGERLRGRGRKAKGSLFGGFGAPHLHLIEEGTAERFHTGERESGRIARALGGRATPQTLQAAVESAGAFGRHAFKNGRLTDRGVLRRTQDAIRRGNVLARFSKVARDIEGGRSTGRVTARPFFRRTVKATAPAMHAAQLAVLKRELEAAASAA